MRAAAIALAVALCAAAAGAQVGAACRGCHPGQTDGWRSNGMSRALEPLRAGELAGLGTVAAGSTGFAYRFETDERGAALVETWSDPSSKKRPSEVQRARVEFAIGAGILDRSYAVRHGDLLRFGPLEVVRDPVTGERHAALAPGHAIDPRSRFTLPIAEECLRCHTSALPPRDHPLDLAPPPGWKPSGIDCVTCHAEAAQHATWRERDLAGEPTQGPDPLQAARANPVRQGLESCARCHLQGDADITLTPPWRGLPGPGEDLFARRATFVTATPTHEIGFVSHVERLAQSVCFQRSFGRDRGSLLCTTCHDPHASVFESSERQRVRDACTNCHAAHEPRADMDRPCSETAEKRAGRACVDCHMRATGVFDVATVRIHDHRIERKPPPPSPPGPLRIKSTRDGRLAHFTLPGRTEFTPKSDPGLWSMALTGAYRRDLALPFARQEPGAIAAMIPGYHLVRGSLLEQAGDLAGAERSYREALRFDPGQLESAVNLGGVLNAQGQSQAAIDLLTPVIEAHPRAEGARRNRALAWLAREDTTAATADLLEAFHVSPSEPVARVLGQLARARGDAQEAARWASVAAGLEPRPAPR